MDPALDPRNGEPRLRADRPLSDLVDGAAGYDPTGWFGECLDVRLDGEVCGEVKEAVREEEWVFEDVIGSFYLERMGYRLECFETLM